jgi:hypothetical protein
MEDMMGPLKAENRAGNAPEQAHKSAALNKLPWLSLYRDGGTNGK